MGWIVFPLHNLYFTTALFSEIVYKEVKFGRVWKEMKWIGVYHETAQKCFLSVSTRSDGKDSLERTCRLPHLRFPPSKYTRQELRLCAKKIKPGLERKYKLCFMKYTLKKEKIRRKIRDLLGKERNEVKFWKESGWIK